MLTRKQKELLDYLTTHAETHDVPPSFDEMRDALGEEDLEIHFVGVGHEGQPWLERL